MKTCPICKKEFENDFALNGHIRLSKDPHHKQHYNEQHPTDQKILYQMEQKKGYDQGFDVGYQTGLNETKNLIEQQKQTIQKLLEQNQTLEMRNLTSICQGCNHLRDKNIMTILCPNCVNRMRHSDVLEPEQW
jgi:flagellar biosynthesis/type III secretory pathway protein FliH